jgi:hypothetical protein
MGRRVNWLRAVLISVPVSVTVVLLAPYAVAVFEKPQGLQVGTPPPIGGINPTPFFAPGIDRPQVVAAKVAGLADDDDVIGVVVNGRPRAYRVKAFTGMSRHVVNDLIDDVPVTVTYCDLADCAQAFTSSTRGDTLDICTGGLNGNLMLRTSGHNYFWQNTGKCTAPDHADESPFPMYPFERVPWKVWHATYPGTDVYVGGD